jgi:hypothetical protein
MKNLSLENINKDIKNLSRSLEGLKYVNLEITERVR